MANFNFNKVILGGRLIRDPETKQLQDGIAVTTFGVAISRPKGKDDKEQQADFINCVAWRKTAEFIAKYFNKGSSISIVGKIQTRDWTDAQGQKRYATEVVVDEVGFVDGKESSSSTDNNTSVTTAKTIEPVKTVKETPKDDDDDSLPF